MTCVYQQVVVSATVNLFCLGVYVMSFPFSYVNTVVSVIVTTFIVVSRPCNVRLAIALADFMVVVKMSKIEISVAIIVGTVCFFIGKAAIVNIDTPAVYPSFATARPVFVLPVAAELLPVAAVTVEGG
jgi:hypothetical protein